MDWIDQALAREVLDREHDRREALRIARDARVVERLLHGGFAECLGAAPGQHEQRAHAHLGVWVGGERKPRDLDALRRVGEAGARDEQCAHARRHVAAEPLLVLRTQQRHVAMGEREERRGVLARDLRSLRDHRERGGSGQFFGCGHRQRARKRVVARAPQMREHDVARAFVEQKSARRGEPLARVADVEQQQREPGQSLRTACARALQVVPQRRQQLHGHGLRERPFAARGDEREHGAFVRFAEEWAVDQQSRAERFCEVRAREQQRERTACDRIEIAPLAVVAEPTLHARRQREQQHVAAHDVRERGAVAVRGRRVAERLQRQRVRVRDRAHHVIEPLSRRTIGFDRCVLVSCMRGVRRVQAKLDEFVHVVRERECRCAFDFSALDAAVLQRIQRVHVRAAARFLGRCAERGVRRVRVVWRAVRWRRPRESCGAQCCGEHPQARGDPGAARARVRLCSFHGVVLPCAFRER